MKVFALVLIFCANFNELSAVNSSFHYRGNSQEDHQRLVGVLDQFFSVAARMLNKLLDISKNHHHSMDNSLGELAYSFQEASFNNGRMITMLMQKSNADNFVALSRQYLPVPFPFPQLQFYNMDSLFNDSIRANQKLNTNIMKMWTQMKGAESRAEQFLMNILNSFEETMQARPDLLSTISKLSGLPIPCYKDTSTNIFLPSQPFFGEFLKEVDLYIELLKILDLKNERQYDSAGLECLRMFAKKFVLSGSKVVSALLELFRHSKEFANPAPKQTSRYVEIVNQLVVEQPLTFNTLTMMFNDQMFKNGAVLNLCMSQCGNKMQNVNQRLNPLNAGPLDIDGLFKNAMNANQQWNNLLMFEWQKFTDKSRIPSDLLNGNKYTRLTTPVNTNAEIELRDISQVLNQAVALKVDLITVLLEIWTKGRAKTTTQAEIKKEGAMLNQAFNMPGIFDQTLGLPTLQNSPNFVNSLGTSELDGLLSGFIADPSSILGLDIGGGLGIDSIFSGGLESILGGGANSILQAVVPKDQVPIPLSAAVNQKQFGEGLIDQRFTNTSSGTTQRIPQNSNKIPTSSPAKPQNKQPANFFNAPIQFPQNPPRNAATTMNISLNGRNLMSVSIKFPNTSPRNQANGNKQAIVFPDNPKLKSIRSVDQYFYNIRF